MVLREKLMFPALNGPDERTAYLYLPETYSYRPDQRYPVLYMFDGHNVFFDSDATYGKSWGMREYMDRAGVQMIIAAVECNHDPDNGRLKEYSPYPYSDPVYGKIEGQGRETMEWLIRVFKADIDNRYRTLPEREHTFIAGSSMGGLMSLYAVLAHNDVFSRAAALSPSVWTNKKKLTELVRVSEIRPDTVIYMDYGSEELGAHPGMAKRFEEMTSELLEKGVFLTSRIVPFGTHCEASWEKQLPLMMNTLLYETAEKGAI